MFVRALFWHLTLTLTSSSSLDKWFKICVSRDVSTTNWSINGYVTEKWTHTWKGAKNEGREFNKPKKVKWHKQWEILPFVKKLQADPVRHSFILSPCTFPLLRLPELTLKEQPCRFSLRTYCSLNPPGDLKWALLYVCRDLSGSWTFQQIFCFSFKQMYGFILQNIAEWKKDRKKKDRKTPESKVTSPELKAVS